MADLPQYTGVTYDAGYFKQPQESMAEYMQRLAMQRASGVLGGGGMLNTATVDQEITDKDLGSVQQNCPAGYRWNGNACVLITESDETQKLPKVSKQQAYEGARWLLDNPMAADAIRAVMPFGLGSLLMSDRQLEGQVRNTQNEATKSQGFLQYLMGKDGDVVLGDRGTGSGSLVTGKETEITRGMFPEIFDPLKFSASYGTQAVNVDPTKGMFMGAITTGPDAINPTSANWSIVDNDSSPTGSISVYTPSEWSPSDITSTPSTSNETPDWYSAATGENWD